MNKLPKDVIDIIYRMIFQENIKKVCAEIHDWCGIFNINTFFNSAYRLYLLRELEKNEMPSIIRDQIHIRDYKCWWRCNMWNVPSLALEENIPTQINWAWAYGIASQTFFK